MRCHFNNYLWPSFLPYSSRQVPLNGYKYFKFSRHHIMSTLKTKVETFVYVLKIRKWQYIEVYFAEKEEKEIYKEIKPLLEPSSKTLTSSVLVVGFLQQNSKHVDTVILRWWLIAKLFGLRHPLGPLYRWPYTAEAVHVYILVPHGILQSPLVSTV